MGLLHWIRGLSQPRCHHRWSPLLGERGQKNVNRQDLVAKYGYDTKYAGHMIRLGYQGVEYLQTGRITLPMPPEERRRCLAIRQGQADINDVLTQCGELEQQLKDLCGSSPLPDEPETDRIESWILSAYWRHWHATWGHDTQMADHGRGLSKS